MRLWDIYHSEIPGFLAEAAETVPMERLRDVGMNCGCEYTSFPAFAKIESYSRFDHSLGVGLIVWHFTGDRAQAMAGLLHDIATPVFAHVVDFMRGDHLKQESTERGTSEVIRGGFELCSVLNRHGLTVEAVEDYHRYPIADNDSPRLSADRLEYTLGNAVNYGIVSRDNAAEIYADLCVGINEFAQEELVFCRRDAALSFAEAALECSKIYVSDADRYAMQILAELVKRAIDEGILAESELYMRESDVIARLKNSGLSERWDEFCRQSKIVCRSEPGEKGVWRRVFAKKRCIDPFVKECGRVSSLFPEFEKQLVAFRNSSQDYYLSAR